MEVLGEIVAPVKPPHPPANSRARIWFYNQAGAQHLICPLAEASDIRKRLISEGAVVWHTEIYHG